MSCVTEELTMIAARLSIRMGIALVAAAATFPVAAAEARIGHQFAVGAGGSNTGAYLLFSWTSPKRVGMYLRVFPLLDDTGDARPNATLTEESAGELGIAVRANRWLTVGVGYAVYEKVLTTYGDPDPLFGIPLTLGSETTSDKGIGAVAIFALPSRSQKVAFALSGSISAAGSGIALGATFGR